MIITNSISKDTVKELKLYSINSPCKKSIKIRWCDIDKNLANFWRYSSNVYCFARNLSKRNGGIKKGNAMSIKRGTAMFKNLCSKSIALLWWTESGKREIEDMRIGWSYLCHVVMLGSKTLGLNVLELQFIMLANHDQNVLVFVLDLLKVCLYVKLELSVLQDLLCKSVWLDWLKIRLDRSKLVQIVFLQNFPTQPKARLTCRVLCFALSIKGKTLATF